MNNMNTIPRRFWEPYFTTQYKFCPIPFKIDTYRGCKYGCLFCFARDLTEFNRRPRGKNTNKPEHELKQSWIEGNDPVKFRRWIEKVNTKEYNYNKPWEVAFKERIPIKIGSMSDPFPLCETTERITYEFLKILQEYDYPVQISTKNPEVFLSYADEFIGANMALNVSCSFIDDDIAKKIEVASISTTRRLAAVKKLSDMGFKITIRVQPFILPYSYDTAERMVKAIKESGAWAFQTEGLKIKVNLPEKERLVYQKMSNILGFDIVDYFKKNGVIDTTDRLYNEEDTRKMLQLYNDLSIKYDIKFLNADNLIDKKYGCSGECCGTGCLRNYKIWGGNLRTQVFPEPEKYSEEIGKCLVSFVRNRKQNILNGLTINKSMEYFKSSRLGKSKK